MCGLYRKNMVLMERKVSTLKVQVLGGFSISYEGRPLSFSKGSSTKAIRLLQILLYYSESGISREQLIEYLFGYEDIANAANNLRVTVHRLKKIISDTNLPEYDYISLKKGIYQWNSPEGMEVIVDALVMRRLIEEAQTEENEEKKIEMLENAVNMYRGTFLPDMAGADWALMEEIFYKNLYSKTLQEVCEWKVAHKEFESALKLSTVAAELYPFDEWQSVKIDCYIGLNHYKDAMKEYEDTAKLFFEELGISPSEKMMKQFDKMSNRMNHKAQDLKEIKEGLRENIEERGAFYCSLPSFRDGYRLMSRIIERNGQSVYLMLCTITNGKGQPMEQGEKLEVMSHELHRAIKSGLRRGDSFTKYSPSQFLLLLVGTNKENCSLIFGRIQKKFAENHRTWSKNLEYRVSSAAKVEVSNTQISFNSKKNPWE